MNMKEAFRYQNKLQSLSDEATAILCQNRNVTRVENTDLRHRVNPEAEDETTVELPECPYADGIDDLAGLLMALTAQRQQLTYAIRRAKQTMELDFDGEVSLNARRQELAALFRRMGQLRNSETLYPGAGVGYKFNAEGNQVSYRCDRKQVVTLNFDRSAIRGYAAELSKEADRISAALDALTVNTQVDYTAPFDVNDTFADVLEWFTERGA